jgi:hypothetical protein
MTKQEKSDLINDLLFFTELSMLSKIKKGSCFTKGSKTALFIYLGRERKTKKYKGSYLYEDCYTGKEFRRVSDMDIFI